MLDGKADVKGFGSRLLLPKRDMTASVQGNRY
jgi:hypothetical protein